jgi:capping protein (actin filament) muscle Z-line, beta
MFIILEIETDTSNGRPFLKCEYNRDGDAYRSPWSNRYFPEDSASPEALYPSSDLLQLEQKFNDIFMRYAHLYFDQGNALTSVYMFDTQNAGFGGCFLIKKQIGGSGSVKEGTWDSIHVVSVDLERQHDGKARYRVNTTVFLKMISANPDSYGNLEIAGNLTRTREETYAIDAKNSGGDEYHIGNIGRLIEANETEIRQEMDSIYINKTKQIVNTGRLKEEYMTRDEKLNFQAELAAAVSGLKKL